MMNEELDIQRSERIHAYVQGTMGDAERAAFELDLAADATLRAEVDAGRTLRLAIQHEPELRFRLLVRRVSEAQEQGGGGLEGETPVVPIGRRNNLRWMAAAASVLVILSVSLWVFTDRIGGPDYHTLAMAELDHPMSSTRSSGAIADQLDSLHQVATKHLLAGNHEVFIHYTTPLIANNLFAQRHGVRTRLDRAYALLKLERPAEARIELNGLDATDGPSLAERAYYLALSYLLEDDVVAARKALEGVAAPFPWDERIARLREGMGQ